MYLFLFLVSWAMNLLSDEIIKRKANDDKYFCKFSSSLTLGGFIYFILRFVPFVNLALASLVMVSAIVIVNNDLLWDDFIEKYRDIPDYVIRQFKLNNIPKENIKENLIIDGANKNEADQELFLAELQKSGLVKDKPLWLDTPTFTEKDYNNARAMMAAEQMLYDVECNVDLDSKQKKKLLKLFKKAYLEDFKNPEIQMSKEDYVVEEEIELVAIGDNNNLVEVEKKLEDTLENNKLYNKVLKIVNK